MAMHSNTTRLAFAVLAIAGLANLVMAEPLPRRDKGDLWGWFVGPGAHGGNNNPGYFFGNGGGGGLGPGALRNGINYNRANKARMAHGILASLAFVIFFPFGAIAVRLLPGRLAVLVHFLLQIFGYIIFTAAVGLGLYVAVTVRFNGFDLLKEYHPVIGLVLFCVLFFQPILGVLHHLNFRKNARRGIFSHIHIWLGRLAITLGMINGGLGLRLAGNAKRSEIIAYGVIAGFIWLLWVVIALLAEARRARETPSRAGGVDAVSRAADKHPRDVSRSPSLVSGAEPTATRAAAAEGDKGEGRFA